MRSTRGFTLLELLLAVAILGFILAIVYGVLSRAINAKNHAEERADLNASGRETVLRMADELEGALPPNTRQGIGFIGLPGKDRVPTDAVQFATIIRREFGLNHTRGGRALVSYSLDPIADRPNQFALRRTEELLTAPPTPSEEQPDDADAAPADAVKAIHLVDQVAALRFRYLDPTSGDWVDSWDTTVDLTTAPNQQYTGLPGAVEITLFLTDSNGGVNDYETIVDLPMANPPPTPTP